jgi:site-specific DNA-cytosine methylase
VIKERTAAILFGGIGGFSAGLKQSMVEAYGNLHRFRILCSIDFDPVACRNHDIISGEQTAVQMDLFNRDQYRKWFGHEPPKDWREVTPWDIWKAFGEQVPDYIFLSPPCKGFSGLLPSKSAQSEKYQALNLLTLRGLELCLQACLEYGGELPMFIHFENVPRITTRGREILDKIKKMLSKYGFAYDERANHNLGEIGGLGQNRLRFLILSRNEKRVPNFCYLPPKKKLKTIGDVIGPLPMPGDTEKGGPLHRLPNLQWKTWVRLALIPAGGDWRDLNKIDWQKYRITHEPRGGAYAVEDWNETSRTVTGTSGPGRSNGAAAVSDPRIGLDGNGHAAIYRVTRYDEPAPCVTGAHRPNNGAITISDPRLNKQDGKHPGVYRIVRVDESAPCVTGTRFGSGAIAIADPKLGESCTKFNHAYKVSKWDEVGGTVASGGGPSNGGHVIADPRVSTDLMPDSYGVQEWDETAKTVRGNSRIMQSASSIADPRIPDRPGRYTDKYRMQPFDKPAATVTCVTDVQSGAQLVADPRINCSPRTGTMGVQCWDEPAKTVIGSGDIHASAAAVADPRIPEDRESGVWVIIAEDGTWHRPLTTYELAMLQGFPTHLPDGRPFQLEGCSDAKAREYIGNAVPPAAAEAMGNVILTAIAKAEADIHFELSYEEIWVNPVEGEWDSENSVNEELWFRIKTVKMD